jgi:formate hydrogenlyase subunit 3/multisubunit Na+/H+ antiporter MnhD subunit
MNSQTFLILPVLLPLLVAALLLPVFRKNPKACAFLGLLSVVICGVSFLLATGSSPKVVIPWVETFTLSFSLDGWKSFLLGFVFLFQLMTAIYSLGAMHRIARPYLYTLALMIGCAASCLVILTDSLLVLLVGWELFLVGLYLMIHSGGDAAEPVARKALIIGGASDFLMILGLMLFFHIAPGQGMAAGVAIDSNPMAFWAFFLIFLGAGAKAGMFPFHTWIPDAAQDMPASGFAAMPASLEKVLGIYFLFILTHQMFVLNETARMVMYGFGLITVFVAIIPALTERDLRKVLALTAISPVGFMICGMATSEAVAMAGALLYMLTHATYKSAMFFAVGNFEEKAGGATLDKLAGIARSMPISAAGFFMAFVAAISFPPTGGFMAKELIFEGALERGHLAVLALLAIGAILNVAVFAKVIAVLWAPAPGSRQEQVSLLSLPTLLLGIAALAGGAIFQSSSALLGGVTGAHEPGFLAAVWHLSPLTVLSLGIYTAGFLVFAYARGGRERAAEAFETLRTSPVLGPALIMAEEKKFDGYEIGIRSVDFLTRIVFRYVEQMIDLVADGIIAGGRWVLRPVLSGAHNGIYSNYLSWTIMGFIIVLFFLFGSSLEG